MSEYALPELQEETLAPAYSLNFHFTSVPGTCCLNEDRSPSFGPERGHLDGRVGAGSAYLQKKQSCTCARFGFGDWLLETSLLSYKLAVTGLGLEKCSVFIELETYSNCNFLNTLIILSSMICSKFIFWPEFGIYCPICIFWRPSWIFCHFEKWWGTFDVIFEFLDLENIQFATKKNFFH